MNIGQVSHERVQVIEQKGKTENDKIEVNNAALENDDAKAETGNIRLLLLGAAESGKTTVLEQISFYDNFDRINAMDYTPTPQDIIMAYCPTTGVQDVSFTVENHSFQLFDFGGQKNDRRKWSVMYDSIDAVIFCIAISEYDQTLCEDGVTNRLHDALELLEHVCSQPKFISTRIFVFLNEIDIFLEKLSIVPLGDYFPDFNGGDDEQSAKTFMEKKVNAMCAKHPNLLHIQWTCAINTEEMYKILEQIIKLVCENK